MSILVYLAMGLVWAQDVQLLSYDMGQPQLTTIWVDPVSGDDGHDGTTRGTALRTLSEAWDRIPGESTLSNGISISITAGTIPESGLPVYMEKRYGTYDSPILIESVDGPGMAILNGPLNVFDCQYLYFLDLVIGDPVTGYDPLHFEACRYMLIRGCEIRGSRQNSHETFKANQCQYLYVEDSNLHGAEENALDFVAVQYGHLRRNQIHDAGDWAAYLKGGSAYFVIDGNRFFDAGTGGFTAGQGTGLEYMVSPWLHYEAMDLKITNNIIHDVEGAAIGVNGGFRILIAYNTAYRIGTRSHLFETAYGSRSCDGEFANCQSNLDLGAWGVANGDLTAMIPDRSIYVYNNIFYNPAGVQSQWQHLAVFGQTENPSGVSPAGILSCDEDFQMRGNVIWNGPMDHPMGIGDGQGCDNGHPSCMESMLRSNNQINVMLPDLLNPETGDYRPASQGNLLSLASASIPDFPSTGQPSPPLAPVGILSNQISRDFEGNLRGSNPTPGAYQLGDPTGGLPSFPIVLPHWTFMNGTWDTVLTLVNASNSTAQITLNAFDSSGQQIANYSLALASEMGWRHSLLEVMPTLAGKAGWLGIDGGSANLTGLMTFTFLPTGGTSSLNLVQEFASQIVLPSMREEGGWISGFALVNLADQIQTVQLKLVSLADGSSQQVIKSLDPGQKIVGLNKDLFVGPIPEFSYMTVTGSANLTGFALTFSTGNLQIVAVPAQ